MKFDVRAAKQLKPDEHLTIEGCPGLRLFKSTERWAWIYRYKSPVDGRMKQVKLGEWPSMSIQAAAGAWSAARDERGTGRDIAAERRTASGGDEVTKGDLTVAGVCKLYHAGHIVRARNLKGSRDIRAMFERMLEPIANVAAENLTRKQAYDSIAARASTPVMAANLKRELAAAWEFAINAGRLPETTANWWKRIDMKLASAGKVRDGKRVIGKRVLAGAEIGELIHWLPNFSRVVEDALTLYLWTGTRGGEIVAMEGREVGEKDGVTWWTIPASKTKTAKRPGAQDHRVPLIGRALEVVNRRRLAYGDGWLFPTNRGVGHTNQNAVATAILFHSPHSTLKPERTRARLSVTGWSAHDLRRTVRTLLASLGVSHEVGEAVLGHAVPGVAGIYNRYRFDREKRAALVLLDAELERLAAAHLKGLAAKPE